MRRASRSPLDAPPTEPPRAGAAPPAYPASTGGCPSTAERQRAAGAALSLHFRQAPGAAWTRARPWTGGRRCRSCRGSSAHDGLDARVYWERRRRVGVLAAAPERRGAARGAAPRGPLRLRRQIQKVAPAHGQSKSHEPGRGDLRESHERATTALGRRGRDLLAEGHPRRRPGREPHDAKG